MIRLYRSVVQWVCVALVIIAPVVGVLGGGDGSVVWSAGLVIERLWVQVLVGVAGEFSSPGSTSCADSYFGIHSTPLLLQYHVKDPAHSVKSAVAGYS